MVPSYKALAHCLFEHCMQFWTPHSKQNTLMLKKVHKAVTVIKGMEQLLCEELWSSLGCFRWEKGHLGMRECHRCLEKSRQPREHVYGTAVYCPS